MTSNACRHLALAIVIAALAAAGWQLRPVRASEATGVPAVVPRIQDDGERFVAYYGQLDKPLSVTDTWQVLRGLRVQLAKLGASRKVAGVIYRCGDELYLAAVDFDASEVFIDRAGARRAFTLIWRRIEADFASAWSPRSPDRIESTDPSAPL